MRLPERVYEVIVAFEGHDGVGKSTIINGVSELLVKAHYEIKVIQNPIPEFSELRHKVDSSHNIELAFLFYLMSSLHTLVRARCEVLYSGIDIVLIDRYIYSTLVSFCARGYQPAENMWGICPKPDLAFWVIVDEKIRRQRVISREKIESHDKNSLDPELISRADKLYESIGMIKIDNSRELNSAKNEVIGYLINYLNAAETGQNGQLRKNCSH